MTATEAYPWPEIVRVCRDAIVKVDGFGDLAKIVGVQLGIDVPASTIRSGLMRHLKTDGKSFRVISDALLIDYEQRPEGNLSPLAETLLDTLRKKRDTPFTILGLCDRLDRGPAAIRGALAELQEESFNVKITDDTHILLPREIEPTFTRLPVELWTKPARIHRYGCLSDTHLVNRNQRLEVLNAVYDLYEQEGIETVLHAGNILDGECSYNRYELLAHGVEGQVAYTSRNYPQRDGIVTRFISADDHEGWWAKAIGLDIGRRMENGFIEHGRSDLIWIGHLERDLSLHDDNPQAKVRIFHPGGGTAYAISYKPQKIAESWQGGEKPSVCLLGHYHKYGCFYYREVYFLMLGTVCDQTMFMRKKPLGADVCASILEIHMTPMGGIGRVKHEMFPFYNREYYQEWDYSSMWD